MAEKGYYPAENMALGDRHDDEDEGRDEPKRVLGLFAADRQCHCTSQSGGDEADADGCHGLIAGGMDVFGGNCLDD